MFILCTKFREMVLYIFGELAQTRISGGRKLEFNIPPSFFERRAIYIKVCFCIQNYVGKILHVIFQFAFILNSDFKHGWCNYLRQYDLPEHSDAITISFGIDGYVYINARNRINKL